MRSNGLIPAASAGLVLLTSVAFAAEAIPDKGTTPYVTHFVFRPLLSIDVWAKRCSTRCRPDAWR